MILNIKNGGEPATLDWFVRKDLLDVMTLDLKEGMEKTMAYLG